MAYDIVDGCTYAFGKSLIIKGRRDTAVLSGIVVYQPINLFRTHAFTDMGCNMVQDGSIQVRAFLNCLICSGVLSKERSGTICPFAAKSIVLRLVYPQYYLPSSKNIHMFHYIIPVNGVVC